MNAVKPKATIPGSVAQSSMRLVAPKPWLRRAGGLAREAEAGGEPGHRAAERGGQAVDDRVGEGGCPGRAAEVVGGRRPLGDDVADGGLERAAASSG